MPDRSDLPPIEDFIREVFEENFELLVAESGHTISAESKQAALNQVLLYWRKLREIAERVTDTEVHLTLPNQETPQGREYTIEGVVDIVREDDRVIMYDIKTHDADYVRANLELYKQQLNVYAHIWQELRQQPLDEMAVIATDFPHEVKEALSTPDPRALEMALAQWEPVIPIEYDPAHKDETIFAFSEVVDKIESGEFAPPSLEVLESFITGGWRRERFATRVCRNCDARFSCDAYRQYAMGRRRVAERGMVYFIEDDPDQEEWRTASLDASTED
ncbi:MAG: hypothetical protein GXN93_04140 [Candidatus Diapherotrites archaeon]|nr:hypothetical protein [Candidatus Diapherotrites archaeon]